MSNDEPVFDDKMAAMIFEKQQAIFRSFEKITNGLKGDTPKIRMAAQGTSLLSMAGFGFPERLAGPMIDTLNDHIAAMSEFRDAVLAGQRDG